MAVTLAYGSRLIFNCNTAFDEQVIANVTAATDTTVKKKGTASSKFTIAAGFTTGIIGSKAITSFDMSLATQIRFWVRSSVTANAGDIKLLIDNTANCASPLETLTVGALVADEWAQKTISLSTPANLTAVISLGLQLDVDLGAQTIYIDDIVLVTETKAINELWIRGFDMPDDEGGYPNIEPKQGLNGSWYENPVLSTTRNITLKFVTTSESEVLFLRRWFYGGDGTTARTVTYDSETVSVVRRASNFGATWADGFFRAKEIELVVSEKTARTLETIPSSWRN